jgi:hypothetical protein
MSDWRTQLASRFARGWDPHVYVDDGWKELVLDLVGKLDATGLQWNVKQIKEKFGQLRFYADVDETPSLEHILKFEKREDVFARFSTLIEDAEEKSATICQWCGKGGSSVTVGSLVQTACDGCVRGKRGYVSR